MTESIFTKLLKVRNFLELNRVERRRRKTEAVNSFNSFRDAKLRLDKRTMCKVHLVNGLQMRVDGL
jgi:hypothetical protein